MSVKVKILSENKKQKIDESMMDLLSDPTMLAAGGAGLIMLYQALFGKKPDPEESLARVRQQINQKYEQAMAGMESSRKEKDMQSKMRDARLRAKLDDLKRQKAMDLPPLEDMTEPAPPEDISEPASEKAPEPKDIKKYIDIMALAKSTTSDNERNIANNMLRKMEKEFPGIQDHPEVQSAEKLNELFRRFL